MKVLIADFDLFQKIGGGQTFYRSIIEKNPDIEFYYFSTLEDLATRRPLNAHPIPFKKEYSVNFFMNQNYNAEQKWTYTAFVNANNVAVSIKGYEFDLIDMPDYEVYGVFLWHALRYHNVSVPKLALSMHGRISTTLEMNWGFKGNIYSKLKLLEDAQFKCVDIRYGISKQYIDECTAQTKITCHYLNPLRFITLPTARLSLGSSERPDLNFIGRTELCKGPDTFVDLVSWLPRQSYKSANIIGPDSNDLRGMPSRYYLSAFCKNRTIDVKMVHAMSKDQLDDLFSTKSITMLPSRYDRLNLIALESLFSGCPTAIGSGAGVIRFLKENFPSVPFIQIDVNNPFCSIDSIKNVLENYDLYREKLVESLLVKPVIDGQEIHDIYSSNSTCSKESNIEIKQLYKYLMRVYDRIKNSSNHNLQDCSENGTRAVIQKYYEPTTKDSKAITNRGTILTRINSTFGHNYGDTVSQIGTALYLSEMYKNILRMPERTDSELKDKISKCWELAEKVNIDRARIRSEIARVERLRGNNLMAATFDMRVMRMLGYDRYKRLGFVKEDLIKYGFVREAETVDAMFGVSPNREERCRALLDEALTTNKQGSKFEFELIDDARKSASYHVSIIVSLYNAADKLPRFIDALKHQTMLKAEKAELILIDSGSPGKEYEAFKKCIDKSSIDVLYARSKNRETIQSAWNRGISLSRAPYLCFLGVDEAILPNCLEILANELDTDSTLDWVQANSLVTELNENGQWKRDIFLYDRTGYRQDLVYLETCYLSWVGALYRKSIHDRFGYYDGTFRAAGDTEFKNRVLPFIKSKAIPRTLGIFWNYKEKRTTQSPVAEIEDMRAWYLHKTCGGVEYAFANRALGDVEQLFFKSLSYRKSYREHKSTDIEYANNLANFILQRDVRSSIIPYHRGARRLQAVMRSLDHMKNISPAAIRYSINQCFTDASQVENEHRVLNHLVDPKYQIFNDNRYEQHVFIWRSDI